MIGKKSGLSLAFLSIFCVLTALNARGAEQLTENKRISWPLAYNAVQKSELRRHIEYLSSIPSRVAGYPGADKAADYVEGELQKLGLKVDRETIQVTVPMVKEAGLKIGNRKMRLFPVWPNVVRTSQLEKGGDDFNLIYGGHGLLQDFEGKDVTNTAVLMEFEGTSSNWLNAPRLGAKAVIFIEPTASSRGEGESKFTKIPLDIPRFWISRRDAQYLLARLDTEPRVNVHLNCDMQWQARPAYNLIADIAGTDPKLKDQTVYIESYYDSMSIVPQLAPGAESASGVASMLELARILKQTPPGRSVRLLATSGHFLGLAGMREYLGQHLPELERYRKAPEWRGFIRLLQHSRPALIVTLLVLLVLLAVFVGPSLQRRVPRQILGALAAYVGVVGFIMLILVLLSRPEPAKKGINLFVALDLSTQSQRVGLFYKGMYFDQREDISRDFSDLARVCSENTALMASSALFPGFVAASRFADGVNPAFGKSWRSFILGKMALDNEPVTLGGGRGVAFVTTDDDRGQVDTPFDTADLINYDNLYSQVTFLSSLFWSILHDAKTPIDEEPKFSRMSLTGGFAEIKARVAMFEPTKTITPDTPVRDSLFVLRTSNTTLMGVRSDIVKIVNNDGWCSVQGVPTVNAVQGAARERIAEAYHVDPETGNIDYAPDLGPQGARSAQGAISRTFTVTSGSKQFVIVVFKCLPVALYDLIDPQTLGVLRTMTILEGKTSAEPRQYGYAIPTPEPNISHIEDVALVFARPGERLKILMGGRLLLLDKDTYKTDPGGLGYEIKAATSLSNTPLLVAQDMWGLDDYRMKQLARYRIVNQIVEEHHNTAAKYIKQAQEALAKKDYVTLDQAARAAWGRESRAYPAIQATMDDVVKGVIFYLLLILPFCYFVERLIFGFPDLRQQIVATLLIFGGICLLFSKIHPAFEITPVPWIIPIAFIMLALSLLVIFIVSGRFETLLRQVQMKMSGVHRADIGRTSVAIRAFALGISNMRRRKARTLFTCVTLILLTFTVLSFTSVSSNTHFNQRPAQGKPLYQGLLVRDMNWAALEDSAYRVLYDEFGRSRGVAPRAWYYINRTEEQSLLTVGSDSSDATYDVKALVGAAPAEAEVTKPQLALMSGRWFNSEDHQVCIIPSAVAERFNLGGKDVGRARIRIGGRYYNLLGIMDSNKLKLRNDLDNEPITPVDYIQMQRTQRGQQSQAAESAGFQEYIHLSPDEIIIIPYREAINLGAQLQSVAISFVTRQEVETVLKELMPRLNFNIYAGLGDRIWKWSAIGTTQVSGLESIFIPILIAALIILNTMLGAVYERIKEIHIFSSIGLSPSHIGSLFMAEAFVYSILGAIFGYLLGQGAAKVLTAYNLLPGLNLNYSSLSAVLSTLIIIGTVLLSTLYPARKASEVATPAIERRWQVPDPAGDNWEIPMPFAVTGGQAVALNQFMLEWFNAYEEYSIGDFVTQDVGSDERESTYGKTLVIKLMAWLAPFDLGVSQQVELHTVPTDMTDVFELKLFLHRESGDVSSWKRVNRRFLNTLRRQFLIWRTLRTEDRERYLAGQAKPAAETAS